MTEAEDDITPAATSDWQPLPEAARRVSTLVGALGWLPFGAIPAVVGGAFIPGWPARIALGLACLALAAGIGAWHGRARWSRTAWRLDDRGLQVRRGLVWRSEVLVPRTRVQHLDLERGPIERRHGLATLVVHTAGTRLYALRQSGFLDADAVALRDALLPEADRHDDAL
ncbi:PH domain-containing protein [Arenimonas daejeonensis]|uniref:PH domain-containing protein n=1 Tax=Arenimonas daejeonensis TaxID=370777 RepID=UPI0011BD67AD|nr:PH domain-containing protein [Arenimonas daejeonensis]